MEKTRPLTEEEMDAKLFISRHSQHFIFIVHMIKVLFPIGTFTWRVNDYFSRQRKGINKGNGNNFFSGILFPFV